MLYARNNSATMSRNPVAFLADNTALRTPSRHKTTVYSTDHPQHPPSLQSAPALPHNEIEIPRFWNIYFLVVEI
jgi:hypothetical protein